MPELNMKISVFCVYFWFYALIIFWGKQSWIEKAKINVLVNECQSPDAARVFYPLGDENSTHIKKIT